MHNLVERLKALARQMVIDVSNADESPVLFDEAVKEYTEIGSLLLRISDKTIGQKKIELKESVGITKIETKPKEVVVILPFVMNYTAAGDHIKEAHIIKKMYFEQIEKELSAYIAPYYGEKHVFWFHFTGWPGDVDNLEVKILIDLLSGYFVPDDNGRYVSIYRTASPKGNLKTVLRIMPEKEFKKVIAK